MVKEIYFKQARLVLQLLPFVMKHDHFALKGGTAINFFVRDLPRVSIDIDLTYIPLENRTKSIENISNSLKDISRSFRKAMRNIRIVPKILADLNFWRGVIIEREGIVVKIEPNLIIRGTVFPCEERELSKDAEELFEISMSVRTLSLADMYGGKICAALDRQHPRDLFDIKLLLENEGLTDNIRKAFLVYLISHNRPIYELLNPGFVDTKSIFEKEFSGMTRIDIKYEELLEAKEELISKIKNHLTDDEKVFLLSFKKKEPDWNLLGLKGIGELPAVRWKLINLNKMSANKHLAALDKLKKVLGF
ncbi:MAG: nucleotidyl transferase AbiEii/AbiGii toxin family protein [Candidatus Aminicenantes bacterium]|nr:MAG: nucleotidyl transferase AbiEii/AbiGii toxin family protein [Candidatus Aminicenantes bacterium]